MLEALLAVEFVLADGVVATDLEGKGNLPDTFDLVVNLKLVVVALSDHFDFDSDNSQAQYCMLVECLVAWDAVDIELRDGKSDDGSFD